VYAQHRSGSSQFSLAYLREARRAGVPRVVSTKSAVTAVFAPRGGQQKDFNALSSVFCERTSYAQGLVVGVCEHGH
jgi:apolipoprotein N-acyltransferase